MTEQHRPSYQPTNKRKDQVIPNKVEIKLTQDETFNQHFLPLASLVEFSCFSSTLFSWIFSIDSECCFCWLCNCSISFCCIWSLSNSILLFCSCSLSFVWIACCSSSFALLACCSSCCAWLVCCSACCAWLTCCSLRGCFLCFGNSFRSDGLSPSLGAFGRLN